METSTALRQPRTRSVAPSGLVASVLVRDVVTGPVQPAEAVATGPSASYLAAGDRVVALVAAGGVRLPCALVVVGPAPPPAGPDLAVGAGAVWHRGRPVAEVARWFDPRVRIAGPDPAAVGRLAAGLRARPCPADALLPAGAPEHLAAALAAGRAAEAAADLVGRGAGLTPAGDDLVAGCLAALRARRAPSADRLAAAVRRLAPARTTRLSAALLGAADEGAVIPEAAAVLRALARPSDAEAEAEALERATRRLVGVGHTSGWYLAAGLAVGSGPNE